MSVLSLQKLVKTYNGRTVVDSVDIEVESRKVVGLLGPNGAGKTTTFYMAAGLIRPESGRVILGDEDITPYPIHIRARKGIGYLPQDASIFRKLSVKNNIMLILETLPLTNAEMETRAEDLMNELGIRHLSESRASVLSGGERRRLEITRVLATNPEFVLFDEPFAGVDPLAVIDIRQIISHLTDKGIGVLISDHNVRETLSVCDNAYIMSNGRVIESGSPEKIATSEIAKKNYLGDTFKL
ncbi:LPS export ABC transporter ATP-binding protein [Desulforegula conservatrix]|uniref:LPS export ABC transporter ATP-binding protein n=1 Tax=Desulforegula conservatrix TaxID=153026 RepID=UPI000426317F|nr:LPS export ABC transporter ATP-binding protein [Desulforegula conservatrix]